MTETRTSGNSWTSSISSDTQISISAEQVLFNGWPKRCKVCGNTNAIAQIDREYYCAGDMPKVVRGEYAIP